MIPVQIVFLVTVAVTIGSGVGSVTIIWLGDTRRNHGQRAVAEKLAQIAVVGATAIAAMLGTMHGS